MSVKAGALPGVQDYIYDEALQTIKHSANVAFPVCLTQTVCHYAAFI